MQIGTSPAFAELLRRHRLAAGLTQEDLAERAGLSWRTISDLERGVKSRPHRDTVALLAAALGLEGAERATFEGAARRVARRAEPVADLDDARRALPADLPLQPTPFLGRERELVLLEQHLAGKGPPLLLIAGEPGIGKTRLVQEVAQRAAACGLSVLAGGCRRRSGQEPFAPLLEALKTTIQRQSPAQARANLRGCAWLVRLLPELAGGPIEPLPAWTLPPEQERRLLFEAVGRFVANTAGPAGTLLVLDDLQWAGADALDLLAALVRSPSAALRVVGAYRDTDVRPGDALSFATADLAQAGLATQRRLAPLTPEDAGRLLDLLLDGAAQNAAAVRQQVVQRTGGVPFFVVSCAQVLRLHGALDGGATVVPWDVAQGIRQRVAALPAVAPEVLGAAAVLGRVVEPALLMAVAGQPEGAVLAALDAAGRARLLVEDRSAYQFAHDLIREVVEADVGAARRALLHRRAAQALESAPGEPPIELLAYHYSRSGEHSKAVAYLEQAGDRAAAQVAQVTAAGYYQEAVDRLEGIGRARDAAGVREKLGAVLLMAARHEAAAAALEPAATAYHLAGDLEGEGRVAAQIGLAYGRRGMPGEALARIQPPLQRLAAAGPSRARAALYLTLAELGYAGDPQEAIAAAERAGEIATTLGDDTFRVRAEVLRGALLDHWGRVEDALPALEGAIPLAGAAGDAAALYNVLNHLAHILDHRGEFAGSLHYIDRALAIAERAGDREWIAFLIMHRGFTAFFSGDWARARWDAEASLALYRQIGAAVRNAHPLMVLGFVDYGEGRWEEATGHLERCVALADGLKNLEAVVMAQSMLAELELRQGRPAAARARLLPLLGNPDLATLKESTYLEPKLAWAHLDLGAVDEAVRMAARAAADARAKSDRLNLVEALRVQALAAPRQERWCDAERYLSEALALAQSMRYPWGEARVLRVSGALHARMGEPAPARERLEAARAIFQQLGARTDAEQAACALGQLR